MCVAIKVQQRDPCGDETVPYFGCINLKILVMILEDSFERLGNTGKGCVVPLHFFLQLHVNL